LKREDQHRVQAGDVHFALFFYKYLKGEVPQTEFVPRFSGRLTCNYFIDWFIGVGAGKFLGVRRIFARIPSNLPEQFFG